METKRILQIALLTDLTAGTLFAWYNSAKEVGVIGVASGSCNMGPSAMFGLPICVLGAIFFTVALGLAIAIWFIKE